MSDMSREEIEAKLEANEARGAAQFAAMSGRFDAIYARLDNHSERMDRLEHALNVLTSTVASLKSTMIITGISSVIAIVLGTAGFNAALLSNMSAMFDSGKNSAEMQYETRRQVEETAALLKKMQQRYDNPAAHD